MGLDGSQRDVVSFSLIMRVSQGRPQVLRQHYNQMGATGFPPQGSDLGKPVPDRKSSWGPGLSELWKCVTVLCTWSMVLQSDENLFRMLPRGVVSKNLRGNQRSSYSCVY